MHNQSPPVQIKSDDPANAMGDLHRAFAAFREANDERLTQIEHRLSSDVVTEEKLTRIDRALDETKRRLDMQTVEKARPRLAAARDTDQGDRREHKMAFNAYMRSRRKRGPEGDGGKGHVGGLGPGRRLPRAPARRTRDPAAARQCLAHPRHRLGARNFHRDVPQGVPRRRAGGWLGRRG